MDWPLEYVGPSESDLMKVFRYAPRETTVIKLSITDEVCCAGRNSFYHL
jgi:hypothetical protein